MAGSFDKAREAKDAISHMSVDLVKLRHKIGNLENIIANAIPWLSYAVDNKTFRHCANPKVAELVLKEMRKVLKND